MKPKTKDEEIRRLKRDRIILIIMVFTVLFYPIIDLSSQVKLNQPESFREVIEQYSEINITLDVRYENLEEDEIKFIENIMKDLEPEYKPKQKSITFVKEINESDCESCVGFNRRGGINVIEYNPDEEQLKATICHELLHTYLVYDNTLDEDLLSYDLHYYIPCFNEDGQLGKPKV